MKISIITVTYNSEQVLKDCINSVANQNYDKKEHIVIDGDSKDSTMSILKQNQNHLTKLISEPDKGIYDAMNKGIKIATGDIVGFLNSDDFYKTSSVLSSVNSAFSKDSKLEACYADIVIVNRTDTSKITRYWKSNSFRPGAFSKGWCPPHPTFFAKCSVYNNYGNFDLSYKMASDVELMMRFLEVEKIKVRYIPEIWINFRNGGISNKSIINICKQNEKCSFNRWGWLYRK